MDSVHIKYSWLYITSYTFLNVLLTIWLYLLYFNTLNNILFKKTPRVPIVSLQYNCESILYIALTPLAERVARGTVNSIKRPSSGKNFSPARILFRPMIFDRVRYFWAKICEGCKRGKRK